MELTLKAWDLSYFSKMVCKKNCIKKYKNHLRSNNHEICTPVAHCFPNNLDVFTLENVHLSSDGTGRPPL
jgi:hypothetical protein